jgi:hypothetical protein
MTITGVLPLEERRRGSSEEDGTVRAICAFSTAFEDQFWETDPTDIDYHRQSLFPEGRDRDGALVSRFTTPPNRRGRVAVPLVANYRGGSAMLMRPPLLR